MTAGYRKLSIIVVPALILGMLGCSSSNCPLNNTVGCNMYFYDSEGQGISFADVLTVKTLLPGYKTIYTYRKLGEQTIVRDEMDPSLVELGYSESVSEVRRDTVLLNKVTSVGSISVPLSYYNDIDTLIFDYASISSSDTLKIEHDSYPYVELPECGTHRFHSLKGIKYTDAAIYAVEIINSKVDYEGRENVKIYFNNNTPE